MTVEPNLIRRVIAVVSGKGGVGKSLVSGLLAVALRRAGHTVGLLDADITGPSIPKLFFPQPVWTLPEDGKLVPARSRTGIHLVSINFLLENEEQAVIWSGPVIGQTIQQFWSEARWGALDYLIIDLPPGTSDAALAVMQTLPLSGVVLVSSPQQLSGMIVCKAAQMAVALQIPMLGLIENMSYYVCPQTGVRHEIFGPSHAEALALKLGVPWLGQLPIEPALAQLCDTGQIEDYPAEAFEPLAKKIAAVTPEAHLPQRLAGAEVRPRAPEGHAEFSERVQQLVVHPENMGRLEQPDARGVVHGSCGDIMQIDLRLEGDLIREARFVADGCGVTVACGSMVTALAQNKPLTEARQITPADLVTALDGLPEHHLHCADLAVGALRRAIENVDGAHSQNPEE